MSVTSFAHGQAAKLGFKYNTNSWNGGDTEATLGANDRLEMLLSGAMPRTTVEVEPSLASPAGPAVNLFGTKATEGITGTIPILAGYATAQRPVMGFFGTEVASTLAAGAYSHLGSLNAKQSGVYATAGWTDALMPHVIPHLKVQSLEFDFQHGKPGIIMLGIVGKKELTSGGGNNTLASINADVTFNGTIPTTQHLILNAAQATIRFANNDDALGAGDKVYPTAVKLWFRRSYAVYRTSRNSPFIDEPISGDWLDIGGEIMLPYEDGTTHRGLMTGNTQCLLDIVFLGDQIGATGYYYQWTFTYPLVSVDTSGLAELSNPSILSYSLPFKAHTTTTATIPTLTIQDHVSTSHLTNGT